MTHPDYDYGRILERYPTPAGDVVELYETPNDDYRYRWECTGCREGGGFNELPRTRSSARAHAAKCDPQPG